MRNGATRHGGRSAPGGFTLVELLVVIMIIAMLAGLLVPAVMQAQATARNAQIKAEIDMLHMAMMNYKNQFGFFPPCTDRWPPPLQFPSSSPKLPLATFASLHLKRVFPKSSATGLPLKKDFTEDKNQNGMLDSGEDYNSNGTIDCLMTNNTNSLTLNLDVNTALAYWLSGYSDDPVKPTEGSLATLFQFDKTRLENRGSFFSGQYSSPGMATNGQYRYVNSSQYFFQDATGNTWPMPFVEFNPATSGMANGEDVNNDSAITAASPFTEDANGNGKLDRGTPFNEDSFQIIHPGRDGQLGTDDDLSNFWPGTRKDFLDSLK